MFQVRVAAFTPEHCKSGQAKQFEPGTDFVAG